MTEAQMRELVSSTFVAAWAAARPNIPLVLENEGHPSADSFAMLTITPTTSSQMTLGAAGTRRTARRGWIAVKLWGPAHAGSAGLTKLADTVRGIIEMVSIPGAGDDPVNTEASDDQPIGTDGRWYMRLVRVPMTWTETK